MVLAVDSQDDILLSDKITIQKIEISVKGGVKVKTKKAKKITRLVSERSMILPGIEAPGTLTVEEGRRTQILSTYYLTLVLKTLCTTHSCAPKLSLLVRWNWQEEVTLIPQLQ